MNIGDEETIMLIEGLKSNTVLRILTLDQSKIGDISFQALLFSLSQLTMNKNQISTCFY